MSQYPMDLQHPDEDFVACWRAAGVHLSEFGDGVVNNWLRAHVSPPFMEHLSFRLGNQLFFIRIEDEDDRIQIPGSRNSLELIASNSKGHACLMPMKMTSDGWSPSYSGWGLLDLNTNRPIDPAEFITDVQIEMTDWELQDFAVQVVRQLIEKEGFSVISWHGNPETSPSIWFDAGKGPEWVVVRAVRYPVESALIPLDIDEIAQTCRFMSEIGHFASVAVICEDGMFEAENLVLRGHALHVRYLGLERLELPHNFI